MRDRSESAVVFTALLVAGVSVVLLYFIPSYPYLIGNASYILLVAYSIYWAFSIRRKLSAHLYRNQALGVGLVGIGWVTVNYSFAQPNLTISQAALLLAILVTFYWIDAAVLAGRKSDPFYRDTLRWKELRLALWPLAIALVVANLAGLLVDPSGFTIVTGTGISQNSEPLPSALLSASFLLTFGVGPLYLLLTAYRSRDRTLRSQLQWFGWFVTSFFVFSLAALLTRLPVFFGFAYVVGTYCLYRSAKSLAPLNPMPFLQPAVISPAPQPSSNPNIPKLAD